MYEGKRVGGQVPQLRFDLAGGIALWRPAVGRSRWCPFTTAGNPFLPLAMYCHRPGRNYANQFESDRMTCENSLLSGVSRKRDRSEATAVAEAISAY